MYLAVVYQDWVVVCVYILVAVIFKEGLSLCHLKVIDPGLLGVKGVKLVFGKVVHDTRSVGVPNHINWSTETIPAGWRGKWREGYRIIINERKREQRPLLPHKTKRLASFLGNNVMSMLPIDPGHNKLTKKTKNSGSDFYIKAQNPVKRRTFLAFSIISW